VIALPAEAHEALAVGWATVDLERAVVELSHLLAPDATFGSAPASVILGARCLVGPAAVGSGLRIVLLEPDTEGRLAATLARAGEGWAATWARDGTTATDARSKTGPRLSVARPGPLGDERLRLGGPPAGPHRLFIEAVPSPP
jgi:hypothetical protein